MSAMSDYLENKLIDFLFRGQSYAPPSTLYIALFTTVDNDANTGTEVSGNAYARASVASALTSWAGTQATGSVVVSSGTNGTTSNNGAITFPTPSGSWGTVVGFGIFDAASGGNLLFWGPLSINKTINQGDTVTFPVNSLALQIDN